MATFRCLSDKPPTDLRDSKRQEVQAKDGMIETDDEALIANLRSQTRRFREVVVVAKKPGPKPKVA